MSPLWRDELGLYVGPQRVVLARMARGVRPKCVADRVLPVASENYGDWLAAMQVLDEELKNEQWRRASARAPSRRS